MFDFKPKKPNCPHCGRDLDKDKIRDIGLSLCDKDITNHEYTFMTKCAGCKGGMRFTYAKITVQALTLKDIEKRASLQII